MKRFATRLAPLGCVLALATNASAQTTWIVDANNGPGASFTAIQPAVTAAQAGDTILVRNGTYNGATVNKGIAILADAGATPLVRLPTGPIPGSGRSFLFTVPAGETAVLHGMTSVPRATVGFGAFVRVLNSAGRVHLDSLVIDLPAPQNLMSNTGFDIDDSAHVSIHACDVGGGYPLNAQNSTVSVTDSILVAQTMPQIGGFDAAGLRSSVGTFANTTLIGGDYQPGLRSGPGLWLDFGATATVTGTASTVIAAGQHPGGLPQPAIFGDSSTTLSLDPRVTLQPVNGAIPSFAPTTIVDIPHMSADGAAPGGTVSASLVARSGDLAQIYLSLPFGPIAPPAPLNGDIWVNLSASIVAGSFTIPASETVGFSFTLVNNPILLGLPVTFQALVLSPGGFRFSAPVTPVMNEQRTMPSETFKLLHVVGLLLLYTGLGGMLLAARSDSDRAPKSPVILHGIGLLVLLVTSFCMLERLQIQWPWPGWFFAKIGVWLALGALPTLMRRNNLPGGLSLLLAVGLGAAAAWLAIEKPF